MEKRYTAAELIEIYKVDRHVIFRAKKDLRLKPDVTYNSGAKTNLYSEKDKELIARFVSFNSVAKRKEWIESLNLDEVKNADHPLVTDLRCMDLNYWPEVWPVCFMDMEG